MNISEFIISDVPVTFPIEPYPQQLYMMRKIINALKNSENCLMELPTGSGKTIALLCSTLAWLKHYQQSESLRNSVDNNNEKVKKVEIGKNVKIYFGTRTHKQIGQVVRELKKTAYSNTRMTILSGRSQTCLNQNVLMSKEIDQNCKNLCKITRNFWNQLLLHYSSLNATLTEFINIVIRNNAGCLYKIENQPHPETTWDIESISTKLQKVKICPYFQFKSWKESADIVFCPYNYILNPFIRKAMGVKLENCIIILDEAHNIEDICREGASVSISQKDIDNLKILLPNILKNGEKESFQRDLRTMLDKMLKLIELLSGKLFYKDENVVKKTWDSESFVQLLKNCDINLENLKEIEIQLGKCRNDINNNDETALLSSEIPNSFMQLIDSFISVVKLIMDNDMKNQNDFSVVITQGEKYADLNNERAILGEWISAKKRKNDVLKNNFILNIWCMNPGIVFKQISDISRSIILTSGTLSPISSFEKELNCIFSSNFQAGHIVKPEKTFLASIGRGPSGLEMKAVYNTTTKFSFQDSLGQMLLKFCEIVPNGILCFFSSFVLIESLIQRWTNTQLINEIKKHKSIFIEPRQTSEMNECIESYYRHVKEGAILFAVFRGKASEGVDFADEAARLVVTVGIPYPSVADPKVVLKMNYNTNKKNQIDGQLLSGSEWYNIQAFRALNQALGRCIRHREDWGAMIMIDSRFDGSNPTYSDGLCAWIQKRKIDFRNCNELYFNLQSFIDIHNKVDIGECSDV